MSSLPPVATGDDRCERCKDLGNPECRHASNKIQLAASGPRRRRGMLVVPCLQFRDVRVGMKVTVLKDLGELSASFRRSPAPFQHSMRRYLGKGGTVVQKDCDKMCWVEFPDGTRFWYPAASLKAADQSGGTKHPMHEHGVSLLREVDGEWTCNVCQRQSSLGGGRAASAEEVDIGGPYACVAGCMFMLCGFCFDNGSADNNNVWDAASSGDAVSLKALLEEGDGVKDINAFRDPSLFTPLHLACFNGHSACVELLLQFGADGSRRTVDLFTGLHICGLRGQSECARLLLADGQNAFLLTKYGKTAPDLARAYGHEVTLCLLLGRKLWSQDGVVESPDRAGTPGFDPPGAAGRTGGGGAGGAGGRDEDGRLRPATLGNQLRSGAMSSAMVAEGATNETKRG